MARWKSGQGPHRGPRHVNRSAPTPSQLQYLFLMSDTLHIGCRMLYLGRMPNPFEKMEAARKQVLEQADQIDKDMRDLERILRQYQLHVVADPDAFTPGDIKDRALVGAKEEAEAIIRFAGYPMSVSDLVTKLVERGYEFEGSREPAQMLTANLLRSPYPLKFYPKLGWWVEACFLASAAGRGSSNSRAAGGRRRSSERTAQDSRERENISRA